MTTEQENFFAVPESEMELIRKTVKAVSEMSEILLKECRENITILESLKTLSAELNKNLSPENYGPGVSISELSKSAPGAGGRGTGDMEVFDIGDNQKLLAIDEELANNIELNSSAIENAVDKTIENIRNSPNIYEALQHETKLAFYLGDLFKLDFKKSQQLARAFISAKFN